MGSNANSHQNGSLICRTLCRCQRSFLLWFRHLFLVEFSGIRFSINWWGLSWWIEFESMLVPPVVATTRPISAQWIKRSHSIFAWSHDWYYIWFEFTYLPLFWWRGWSGKSGPYSTTHSHLHRVSQVSADCWIPARLWSNDCHSFQIVKAFGNRYPVFVLCCVVVVNDVLFVFF